MVRSLGAGFAGLVLLAGCRTTGVREDTAPARSAASAEPAKAPAPDAAAELVASTAVTALFPVIEGACPSAAPYEVGKAGVLVIRRGVWVVTPEGARSLFQMKEPVFDLYRGAVPTDDHVGQVGGIDEAHAWVQTRTSSGRGEDMSVVRMQTPGGWKSLETPRGEMGFYAHSHALSQPDGSVWVFGGHSMYADIPGDRDRSPGASGDRYFAFSADGAPLKVNLPGPDMESAVRMPSGELVGTRVTSTGKSLLVRWSPVKKVDDLVVPGATKASDLGVGTTRAVVLVKEKHAFYSYTGEALRPSEINARVKDVASWLVTTSDELMVTTADGSLLVESKDGAVTEEKLPEPGRLAAEASHPWLIGKSGALYTRAGAGWKTMDLPASPWAAETHPPSRVEWVRAIGGETWVSTVRTDAGFGQKKPGEVRTLYASKPRPAPLRCGSPFPLVGLAPFPVKAGASCATPVVVIASEREEEAKTAYPKIGAALKGNAALGESLTFVGFGAGPNRLLGILAPTPEIVQELTRKLGPVAAHAPEVVCGAADESRRFTLQVKTGTFAP